MCLKKPLKPWHPKEYALYDEEDVTDCSFISDDEIIETDEEHLAEMEDKDMKTVDVGAIQANITTITQGLHMAADGYEQLNEKLSTVPPEHVISLVEQVPLTFIGTYTSRNNHGIKTRQSSSHPSATSLRCLRTKEMDPKRNPGEVPSFKRFYT